MRLTLTAVDSISRPVKVLELPDDLSPEGVTQGHRGSDQPGSGRRHAVLAVRKGSG